MAGLVLDASLAASWCFPDERTDYTNAVLKSVSRSMEAIAPRLWAYEVRNGVLMGMKRGRITKTDAEAFLVSLQDLPIHLTDPLSYDHVFALAERHGLTVYDAAYLDIALREALPLASLDGDLIRAARQSGVAIFQA
jgi:predicted nucleic acid-binding protein